VVVVVCGVGKVNAALCVQVLVDCFGVTHVVNTGVAGSLCNDLDIADFVIGSAAIYHDFDCSVLNSNYVVGQVPGLPVRYFPADEIMVNAAFDAAECVNPGHAKIGIVASGDQFVSDKDQKAAIVKNTQALCTEMEGAAIAHAAWKNGIPFVIIRAISDKADDSAQMDYPVFEKIVHLPIDYTIVGEYVLKVNKFEKIILENIEQDLSIEELKNGEFRVFELKRA